MIKKLLVAVPAILVALTLFAAPAFAHHKPDHYPPGCQPGFSEGRSSEAPGCQKHPGEGSSLSELRRIVQTLPGEASGITVGMISLGALGTFAAVLMVQHRRRLQALRR